MNKSIDLNCDMGEGFGSWPMGNDAAIMPLISSANIACGFHAGDPATIRKTIELAVEYGVSIGAHPSYPDLEGFGRREMSLSTVEVYDCVSYQIAALKGMAGMHGAKLRHVKPHGALYNRAARDRKTAEAIAKAVYDIDPGLVLYGLSGSHSIETAKETGLRTANEVFADRTYTADGSLTPRDRTGALISVATVAVEQALKMVTRGIVTAADGGDVDLVAETICIHGDGDHALEFARAIRSALDSNNIRVEAFG